MTTFDRRSFMRVAAVGAGAVATGFRPATAVASTRPAFKRATRIAPSLTQAGPELALLPGFTYKTFAAFGSPMSDGFITPPIHDGMGVFDQPGGGYRIVRNHELGDSNDNRPGTVLGDPATAYDKKAPGGMHHAACSNDNAHLLEHFISLNGTDSNCSGSPTPWGTWLTCEETTVGHRRRVGQAARLHLRGGSVGRRTGACASRSRRWAGSPTRRRPSTRPRRSCS